MNKSAQVKESSSQNTKEVLLDAALLLFSERGFDGVSLRNIAEKAGVNHAMIKYYFNTKALLWKEAIDYLFERSNRELSISFPPNTSQLERAKGFIRRYVEYCARYPEHAKIILRENLGQNDLANASFAHIKNQHERIRVALKHWIDLGLLPNIPVPSLIYCIVGMSQLPFALNKEIEFVHGIDVYREDEINAHCDSVISLLFREK